MYVLKSPKMNELSKLGRALDSFLKLRCIDMVDRRNVTALTLGVIAGGSLPVLGGTDEAIANNYRTQHTAAVKQWLGRLAEGVQIDIELASIVSFLRYQERCKVAFPELPTLCLSEQEQVGNTYVEPSKIVADIFCKYPCLKKEIPYELRILLVDRSN